MVDILTPEKGQYYKSVDDVKATRRAVKRAISNDKMIPLVGTDTTYADDVKDLKKGALRNTWKFLRSPIEMDVNPFARMGLKFAVEKFDQSIEVVRALVFDRPALTRRGGTGNLDNLKAFDINTGKYMNKRLQAMNEVALTKMEPLFDRNPRIPVMEDKIDRKTGKTIQVQKKDDDGNPMFETEMEPELEADIDESTNKQKVDPETGKLPFKTKVDEDGKPVLKVKTDSEGNPIYKRGESVATGALDIVTKLEDFKTKLGEQSTSAAQKDADYQNIMDDMGKWLDGSFDQIQDYVAEMEKVIKSINDIHVPSRETEPYSFFRAHLDYLRQKATVARDQAIEMYDGMKTAYEELEELGNITNPETGENAKIKGSIQGYVDGIFARVNRTVDTSILKSEQICDEAYIEVARKRRIRDRITGEIVSDDEPAWAAHYRKQKSSVDNGFVARAPRRMPIFDVIIAPDNTENFALKTIGFFDEVIKDAETGRVKTDEDRQPNYAEKMVNRIAQGYMHGYAEDMVASVQYLKFHEDKGSYEIFPAGFADLVRDQMVNVFTNHEEGKALGLTEEQVRNDPHIEEFLSRLHAITEMKLHSPVIGGQRDTAKKLVTGITPFIGATYYPMPNPEMSKGAQTFATPFVHDYVEKPMIMARSKLWAYFTGARLVDVEELGRPPKEGNNLEEKLGKAFKWDLGTVPLGEDEKKGFLGKRFNRLPSWVKGPVRIAMSPIGIGAAALMGAPLLAVGAAAAFTTLNYGQKAVRGATKLPVLGSVFKKATTYATYLGGAGAAVGAVAAIGVGAPVFSLLGAPAMIAAGAALPVLAGGGYAIGKIVKEFKRPSKDAIRDSGTPKKGWERFGEFAKKNPSHVKDDSYKLEKPKSVDNGAWKGKEWKVTAKPVEERAETKEERYQESQRDALREIADMMKMFMAASFTGKNAPDNQNNPSADNSKTPPSSPPPGGGGASQDFNDSAANDEAQENPEATKDADDQDPDAENINRKKKDKEQKRGPDGGEAPEPEEP